MEAQPGEDVRIVLEVLLSLGFHVQVILILQLQLNMSTFPWISSNNLIHVKLYSHYSKTLSRVKIPDILSLKYRKNK